MKNLSYVINATLALAIVILFVLHFSSRKAANPADNKAVVFGKIDSTTLPIAYVNVDTLLNNYNYAKQADDKLTKKRDALQATANSLQRQLQDAQTAFQNKVQTNQFLDKTKAQQEYQSLQKTAADYQQRMAREEESLRLEQFKLNKQVVDSLQLSLSIYNKKAHYEMIISNNGGNSTVLYAKDKYNITEDVLKLLNSRCPIAK